MAKLTRRAFLITGGVLGGGLALGYVFTPNRLAIRAPSTTEHSWLTSWVSINADNTITVLVPHVEMGQGVFTSLSMMVAEELEADWSLVKVEQAPAEDIYVTDKGAQGYLVGELKVPNSLRRLRDYAFYKLADAVNLQVTGGSVSVRFTGQWGLRVAGAAAKDMLLQAAAKRWGVPRPDCSARLSHVYHDASGRTASFADLASAAAELTPSLNPTLKDRKDYVICGKPINRFDIPDKVDGSLQYSMDLQFENMGVAAIRHAPVFGGDVSSFDSAAVNGIPGVKDILQIPGAVLVTADNYWRAEQAIERMNIKFSEGENGNYSSEQMFQELGEAVDSNDPETDHEQGSALDVLSAADEVIEAEYRVPLLAHATMEPLNCVAYHHEEKLDVWVGNQDPLGTRVLAAETAGLDMKDVTIHSMQLGGGFGRRSPACGNFIEDAVQAAMQVDYPVKVIWSREEDIRHDYYRPAALSRFKAVLNGDGMPSAWLNGYTDIGVTDHKEAAFPPYSIEHQLINRFTHEIAAPVSYWRSVEASYQAYFIESFIDELATRANIDPLEYRLKLLKKHPRYQKILKLAAEKIGWDNSLPEGLGMGIGLSHLRSTPVVQIAQVSLHDHEIRIEKIVAVLDIGEVINPLTARAQVESGIIYGLTAALYGEITLAKGRVVQSNFPNYEMVRLANTPQIDVQFVEDSGIPGGLGEVAVAPTAPAVCNAIVAANGPRIRQLPIKGQLSKRTI